MNCIIVDDDMMSRAALRKYVERTDALTLVAECKDAMEAQGTLLTEPVDVVFLDIHMPGMSGIELIKNIEQKPFFIFTTGRKDYAIEAFENNALDYLVKPIEYSRFLKAVERASLASEKKKQVSGGLNNIFVKAEPGRLVKIKAEDIFFIEALADYVIINKQNEKFTVHTTMKGIEKKLPPNEFVRVHRSYIVRIDKITEIEENTLTANHKVIPIGRAFRNDLISRLNFI